MLKLYYSPTSVCSIKVRIGLAEIGLDYEKELLNLQAGEQHQEAYLALNPDGVVPTLIDDDLVVVESSLILEYLDREYNQSRLMPVARVAQVAARHWLLRAVAIHAAINTLTFSTGNRDKILASKTAEEIAASLQKMPDPVGRMKRHDLFKNGLSSPYVEQALMHLRRTFADMNKALAKGDWVTGPEFGIADIAIVSYIDRLERLGFAGMWQHSPRVGEWLARMQARPSYEEAVTSQIDPETVRTTRQGAEKHWPELERLWTAS